MSKKAAVREHKEELNVRVYTPAGVVCSAMAEHIVAPGQEGDIMILPEHCGLVLPLRIGILEIHHPDSVEYCSLSGGTMTVEDNSIVVSAIAAESGESIDAARAISAKQRAEAALASEEEDHIIEEARGALFRALARLEAHDLARRE